MRDVKTTTTTTTRITTATVGKVVRYAAAGRTSWLDNQHADEPCGWIPNDGSKPVPQAAVIRLNGSAGRGTCGFHAAIPYVLTRAAVAVLDSGKR